MIGVSGGGGRQKVEVGLDMISWMTLYSWNVDEGCIAHHLGSLSPPDHQQQARSAKKDVTMTCMSRRIKSG